MGQRQIKLLSRFLWWLEKRLGTWRYQYENIDKREIPGPEKLQRIYSNTILSMADISQDKEREECITRLSTIILWAFKGRGINIQKTKNLLTFLQETKKITKVTEIEPGRLVSDLYKTPFTIYGITDLYLLGLVDIASILVYQSQDL